MIEYITKKISNLLYLICRDSTLRALLVVTDPILNPLLNDILFLALSFGCDLVAPRLSDIVETINSILAYGPTLLKP